ncbi:DUF6366 family protein [Salibacterium aidingense]|uniref:DUF6366 family protein n=1 Tax=Salibacterium aidingense TaxID=384933 RepID=UPI003BE7E34B
MRNSSGSPNEQEQLRQEERKRNAGGTLNDGYQRARNGYVPELTFHLGWKGRGLLIAVVVVVFIIVSLIMN